MKKFSSFLKQLWKDESAQGATEYILLLVIVVAIALMFRTEIQSAIQDKIGEISSSLGEFSTSP